MLIDKKLRPQSFRNFIGQKKLINIIKIMIKSSIKAMKKMDHVLLYGNSGTGKTTLAGIISHSLEGKLKVIQGSSLDKKIDVFTLFASLEENTILFIDEIHGINKNIEELIYSALEEGVIDVLIGNESEGKIVRINLPKFILIGATTLISKISKPLKARFGLVFKMSAYNDEDIFNIISNSQKILKLDLDQLICKSLVSYTSANPRQSNIILKRIQDYKIANNLKKITLKNIPKILFKMGYYNRGLEEYHLEYLRCIYQNAKST
jgi:Holliday junction DNA helicase RuvB